MRTKSIYMDLSIQRINLTLVQLKKNLMHSDHV